MEYIENGKITLIASTTDNPYFCVYNALLSRSTIFEFKSVSPDQVYPAVLRAFEKMAQRLSCSVNPSQDILTHISSVCGGDVRKAVNAVELIMSAAQIVDGQAQVSLEDAIGRHSTQCYAL